jgi:hypothetical protein
LIGSSRFCMEVIEDFVSYLIHKNDMLKGNNFLNIL